MESLTLGLAALTWLQAAVGLTMCTEGRGHLTTSQSIHTGNSTTAAAATTPSAGLIFRHRHIVPDVHPCTQALLSPLASCLCCNAVASPPAGVDQNRDSLLKLKGDIFSEEIKTVKEAESVMVGIQPPVLTTTTTTITVLISKQLFAWRPPSTNSAVSESDQGTTTDKHRSVSLQQQLQLLQCTFQCCVT